MNDQLPWDDDSLSDDVLTATPLPVSPKSHITFYPDMVQGSDEWHAIRCGLLTASEMKLILTPTLKIASNEKERAHLYELAVQRITRFVEPQYVSDDMLRGKVDEIKARAVYEEHYKRPITPIGFITNNLWGFTIGYSPDGLVGETGLVEFKSRRQKFQLEMMVECVPTDEVPEDFVLQVQTGLLVAEREWLDFGSFSGGMPMPVVRVWPDREIQDAIVAASANAERKIAEKIAKYREVVESRRFAMTEREVEQEMIV